MHKRQLGTFGTFGNNDIVIAVSPEFPECPYGKCPRCFPKIPHLVAEISNRSAGDIWEHLLKDCPEFSRALTRPCGETDAAAAEMGILTPVPGPPCIFRALGGPREAIAKKGYG